MPSRTGLIRIDAILWGIFRLRVLTHTPLNMTRVNRWFASLCDRNVRQHCREGIYAFRKKRRGYIRLQNAPQSKNGNDDTAVPVWLYALLKCRCGNKDRDERDAAHHDGQHQTDTTELLAQRAHFGLIAECTTVA